MCRQIDAEYPVVAVLRPEACFRIQLARPIEEPDTIQPQPSQGQQNEVCGGRIAQPRPEDVVLVRVEGREDLPQSIERGFLVEGDPLLGFENIAQWAILHRGAEIAFDNLTIRSQPWLRTLNDIDHCVHTSFRS